jgi:hypothetical protein
MMAVTSIIVLSDGSHGHESGISRALVGIKDFETKAQENNREEAEVNLPKGRGAM